jgi:putative phage-type endonuclease
MEQRSPEWYAARLGKWTGSRVADATAMLRGGGWGASRERYMGELIAERLTGVPMKNHVTPEMQWGIDQEADAKAAYMAHNFCIIQDVGFIEHPRIPMSGTSPDGLIDDDGQVEIKCPLTSTHLDTLLGETFPERYFKQVQWGMAVTGRRWCDWVSFDPRMPPRMQLYVLRVNRDDAIIGVLEKHCIQFLKELADKIAELEIKYGRAA